MTQITPSLALPPSPEKFSKKRFPFYPDTCIREVILFGTPGTVSVTVGVRDLKFGTTTPP